MLKQVSSRGKIFAIPEPLQITPRYILKYRKIQQNALYEITHTFKKLPRKTFADQPPYDHRGIFLL